MGRRIRKIAKSSASRGVLGTTEPESGYFVHEMQCLKCRLHFTTRFGRICPYEPIAVPNAITPLPLENTAGRVNTMMGSFSKNIQAGQNQWT